VFFPHTAHLKLAGYEYKLPNTLNFKTQLKLVYQDPSLLVLVKPAGMLSVPGRGVDKQDCLAVRVQQLFPDALVVHRLDMATSGLIVFARGAAMQSRISQMFRERAVQKRYIAVVAGQLAQDCGEIALPLSSDWLNRPKQRVNLLEGKPSLTKYEVLSYNADNQTSRVFLEPVTGRTHQLRVHLAAINHPILGDALYGDATAAPRLLLHACYLSLAHPLSGVALICQSDADF
jgi:tRNA pseudouridine32 synthase/23S rRNA pseudouridine746 synthase